MNKLTRQLVVPLCVAVQAVSAINGYASDIYMNEEKSADFQLDMRWSGGMEFGSNYLTIDQSGIARAQLFDTVSWNIPGAGVYEVKLDSGSLSEVREINKALCSTDSQSGRPFSVGGTNPPETFSVACLQDGKLERKTGIFPLIPQLMFDDVNRRLAKIFKYAVQDGRKKIKLDVSIASVVPKNGRFEVVVDFVNSGECTIKFKRPDMWSGVARMETFDVGALLVKDGRHYKGFKFNLAASDITLEEKLPEWVELKPGAKVRMRFSAAPEGKFKKGEYAFGAVIWMYAQFDKDSAGPVKIDFTSNLDQRTHITFDRDYPSTPKERAEWEAKHRVTMSSQPVKPGATFAEDGLYRAVRLTSGGYRSLQLTPFKAGDVATTSDVKMPMESGHGIDINGPVQWIWEGSAPIRTSEYSTEYVDGTQHVCGVGTPCPRSGRWVARIRIEDVSFVPQYRYDTTQIVTMRRDQKMPSIRTNARDADWEWVGA